MSRQLHRAQTSTALSTSDSEIAGPNPRRYALIIDAPPPLNSPQLVKTQQVHNASGAATGVVQSYTVPAGAQAYLQAANWFLTAGVAPTIALQLVRGGVTTTLQSGAANVYLTTPLALMAGDTIQWNVTTLGAGATMDMMLSILQDQPLQQVTISFQGPAVLNNGHNLYPGAAPLILTHDHIGQAIREDIHAIAASGAPTITVTDIFEVDCDCGDTYRAPATITPPMKGVPRGRT